MSLVNAFADHIMKDITTPTCVVSHYSYSVDIFIIIIGLSVTFVL